MRLERKMKVGGLGPMSGGIVPSGTLPVTVNGTYDVTQYASAEVNVPNPSTGKLDITDTNVNDVTNYAQAQVVDANLVPENIKKDVTILGRTGTYGGVDSSGAGVKFIDYDGTLVDFWPASDVASKTALPANPTGHTRLVAEGWNWTLTDIKSYMASYPNAVMTVGQMYHTASGKTELDITVTTITGKAMTCDISGEKDWGDGTINTSSYHTYTDYGDYTIKCSATTISSNIFGSGGPYKIHNCCTAAYIASTVTSIGSAAFQYCRSLKSVTISSSVTSIAGYVFGQCYSLQSVTIPSNVTSIGDSDFAECYSLTSIAIPNSVTSIGGFAFSSCSLLSVTIPSNVTSIGGNAFGNCYPLASVTIPNGATSIGSNAFTNLYSLTSVTISNGATSIGAYAFNGCYSIVKYDFSAATSVPTLSNTNAFNNINGICRIVVPDALYDSWTTATNWSTYASRIFKVSEVTD